MLLKFGINGSFFVVIILLTYSSSHKWFDFCAWFSIVNIKLKITKSGNVEISRFIIFSKMDVITPQSLGTYEAFYEKSKRIQPLKVGPYIFRLELDPPNNELLEKAKNELNESIHTVNKGLAEIRELLQGEPELNVPDDDYFLTKFLRPFKWHAKSAFEMIKHLYHYHQKYPVYNDDLTPMNDRDVLTSGVVAPLPVRTSDGCRLFLLQGGTRWDPSKISLTQILRGMKLLSECAVFEPTTQICGVRILFDLGGLTLSHAICFTPSYAKAVLEWVQKCFPGRVKSIHFINNPFLFNMVFALFKPFLTEKLRKRIHFHGADKESLLKLVDRKAVPKYMGGDLDVPIQPLGKPVWEYYCNFQEEFEGSETWVSEEKVTFSSSYLIFIYSCGISTILIFAYFSLNILYSFISFQYYITIISNTSKIDFTQHKHSLIKKSLCLHIPSCYKTNFQRAINTFEIILYDKNLQITYNFLKLNSSDTKFKTLFFEINIFVLLDRTNSYCIKNSLWSVEYIFDLT
ncbi:Similar to Ttpa: Alpha-tocopherol transfer protein (Mus musculus) [Cotesia congregata]|uniref:Similar to Ttpa: Alpha-tocopherol transfer protein (Mus musculus) n=1 Tax=Cotesia congregata TaxID=51543 RepID=A0A8J2HGE6_COTCN|nr:Similar to Ttpa: Alpha-tocopherol transfer protein (Mus musculus) [Cotesia congregata]